MKEILKKLEDASYELTGEPSEENAANALISINDAILLINSIILKNKWIPITEHLPELEQTVLLLDDWESSSSNKNYKDIRVGHLSAFTTRKNIDGLLYNEYEWKGTEFAFNITHWMPLPELP